MTWRQVLIAKILLIIARMAADDPRIAEDLKNLSNHIALYAERNQPGEDAP